MIAKYAGFVGVSEWTSELETIVRADAESVVRWWTHPTRRLEERVRMENFDVDDFVYREWISEGERTWQASYATKDGVRVRVLQSFPAREPGSFEHTRQGWVLVRSVTSQERHFRNGRMDASESHNQVEFIPALSNKTRVRLTATRRKTGGPWWERYLPPNDERHHMQTHLDEMAARCEFDLGVALSSQPKEKPTYFPPWSI